MKNDYEKITNLEMFEEAVIETNEGNLINILAVPGGHIYTIRATNPLPDGEGVLISSCFVPFSESKIHAERPKKNARIL